MMLALAAIGTALACDWVEHGERAHACDEPPPRTTLRVADDEPARPRRDPARDEVQLRYAAQYLGQQPAHHAYARLVGRKDAYIGAEVRWMPANEIVWAGRAGAGFDVFGKSKLDLTFGLWLGGMGVWDQSIQRAVIQHGPVAGTEVALGTEVGRVFAKYRWLGGWGIDRVSRYLTENELTIGYRVLPALQVLGQYLVLDADRAQHQHGVGLGLQATL